MGPGLPPPLPTVSWCQADLDLMKKSLQAHCQAWNQEPWREEMTYTCLWGPLCRADEGTRWGTSLKVGTPIRRQCGTPTSKNQCFWWHPAGCRRQTEQPKPISARGGLLLKALLAWRGKGWWPQQ